MLYRLLANGHTTSARILTVTGASLPVKTGHSPPRDWCLAAVGSSVPSARPRAENTAEARGVVLTGRVGSVTDLRRETGNVQGHDNGKFFREEVTSGEDPRGREAQGVGGGGRELGPRAPWTRVTLMPAATPSGGTASARMSRGRRSVTGTPQGG